ncbi:MAG: Mth938-like domain-containing protein [Chitinivibrionales bacterium]
MRIEEYSFGRMRIRSRTYTSDLLIREEEVLPDWIRRKGHDLCIEDLEQILTPSPETLIIGTGSSGVMRVREDLISHLESEGIEVFVRETPDAAELFNSVQDEATRKGRRLPCAGFHLTC